MRPVTRLTPAFVQSFPDRLEAGTLYLSMEFASVAHLCACGCGAEVITPLSPTDWQLYFDGVGITLEPSIGNWSLPCRSHYLVQGNRVVWAGGMSNEMIKLGRRQNRRAKNHYSSGSRSIDTAPRSAEQVADTGTAARATESTPNGRARTIGLLARLRRWLLGHSQDGDDPRS